MADSFNIVIAGPTLTASVQLSHISPHASMVYHILQGTLYEILCECKYKEVPISHTATHIICFSLLIS